MLHQDGAYGYGLWNKFYEAAGSVEIKIINGPADPNTSDEVDDPSRVIGEEGSVYDQVKAVKDSNAKVIIYLGSSGPVR